METVGDLLPDLSGYAPFALLDLESLDASTPLSPCGIIAKYVFSDAFELTDTEEGQRLEIDETNIALPHDLESKFKPATYPDANQWLNVTNGRHSLPHLRG